MPDYDFSYPKYQFDPANYEDPSGPAFTGVPNYDFSVPAPMVGLDTAPAPLADVQAPTAPAFSIDTGVPAHPQGSLEDQYTRAFGGAPREPLQDTVGMEAVPPGQHPATPPAARPVGLALDDALKIAAAGQAGGAVRDPRAVAEVQSLRGERQQMYEKAAARAEQFGREAGSVQDQVAQTLEERRQWAEQWTADEQKRQAERQERAREYQTRIEAKSREAADAAASVDGNRLMRGGGGVLMSLGMALGAFGASIAKTPNFALQIVQAALDRDFEAQKENVRGKDRQASVLRDIYDGFRAEGRDEMEAKLATRAVMLDTFATKVDQMTMRLKGGEERLRGEQMATELRMAANAEKLQAAELAARPRGTKGQSPAELAEQALKLQKMSLENEAARAKLEGGDPEAKTVISEKQDLDKNFSAAETALNSVADLDVYSREGYETLPGASGGLNPFSKDTYRGARTALSKQFGGGTGESELEGRIRAGLIAAGAMKFYDTTGAPVRSDTDAKQAEELVQGNASVGAVRSDILNTAKNVAAKIKTDMQRPSISARDRQLYQSRLNALEAKLKSVGTDPAAYREKFGSKE